jgi:recombination associated protein RdgC
MKQLKQFVPLSIDNTFYDWLGLASKAKPADLAKKIDHLYSTDPIGASWATIGLVPPVDPDCYVHDLDGTARLLMFQINERNLPGAVRNEELDKRVKRHQEQSGLPVSKADYARMRDEVEEELLPKAFIRRTLVPVLVYKDKMLICTVSQKKLDDVLRELFKLASVNATIKFEPQYWRYDESCPHVFKLLATDQAETDAQEHFTPGNALQLKGEDKRTITIKDREAAGHEVQALIDDEAYSVVELRVGWALAIGADDEVEFTMNERGHFKKVIISGDNMADISKEDKHATAWITAKTYNMLLADVVAAMGGFAKDDDDLGL